MNKQSFKELCRQTFGHFCSDAACAVVTVAGTSSLTEIFKYFVLYNFLAFCLQPAAGRILDKFKQIRLEYYVVMAFLLLLTAFVPSLNIWLKVVLAGLGSCLFHVGAGTLILNTAGGKMMPLGVFVSAGALGVSLGIMCAEVTIFRSFIYLCLILLAFANLHLPNRVLISAKSSPQFGIVILLCLCVAVRSFMGFVPVTEFVNTPVIILTVTFMVFAGKFLGGFLCDAFGIKKVVVISAVAAAILFMPALENPYLWATLQLIVNFSMPITLYLLYKCMPQYPATAFGLTAFFLAVGVLPALAHIQVPAPGVVILILLNSAMILYAERRIK